MESAKEKKVAKEFVEIKKPDPPEVTMVSPATSVAVANVPNFKPAAKKKWLKGNTPSRKIVVVETVDPCCTTMSLTRGVIFVAIVEIIAYMLELGFYIHFVKLLDRSSDEEVKEFWGHPIFYEENQMASIKDSETTALIRRISVVQAVICCIYALVSAILIVGAVIKVRAILMMWIMTIFLFTVIRVFLLVVATLPAFQFGLIWFIFELYFMFVVSSLFFEIKAKSKRSQMANVEVPAVEPIGDSNDTKTEIPSKSQISSSKTSTSTSADTSTTLSKNPIKPN